MLALAASGGRTSILTHDRTGQAVAALVPPSLPAEYAELLQQVEHLRDRVRQLRRHLDQQQARAAASAAGWTGRIERVRTDMIALHHREQRALRDALAQAWAELDRLCPAGRDRQMDWLRAAHRGLITSTDVAASDTSR